MSSSGVSSSTNTAVTFPGSNTPLGRDPGSSAASSAWFRFWQVLFQRTGAQAGIDAAALKAEADNTAVLQAMMQRGPPKGLPPLPLPVTPSASPFSYPVPFDGTVIVNGGTVSAVAFSRDGSTFYTVGEGAIPVNRGDVVKVTYTGVPTMTMVGR